ncbi:MAG: signal peptidase I [Oscillospiraceae bacterium]|nr:signal peptidase I [Oscillospiraceae bacterium]
MDQDTRNSALEELQEQHATAADQNKEKTDQKEKHSFLYDIYSLLHDLVYILAAITLVFVFCVRLVGVSGRSMYPTLEDHDYLALQSNVIMGELEYGDIIVARELSFEDGEPIVKRVIATEHQDVLIKMGDDGYAHVFVDGVELDEPYICEPMFPYYFEQDQDQDPSQFSMTVGEDCIFVMGDNRNNSSDSRVASIGEIKVDQVLGKVLFIVFPGQDEYKVRDFDRIGAVS